MQYNTMNGRVARIMTKGANGWEKVKSLKGTSDEGTLAYVTIAENIYNRKTKESQARFIDFMYFVPKNLVVEVGQSVIMDFVVDMYKDNTGFSQIALRGRRMHIVSSRNTHADENENEVSHEVEHDKEKEQEQEVAEEEQEKIKRKTKVSARAKKAA